MGEHARQGPGARGRADEAECGVFDIRIDREGLWFYHGSPIGRKELVKLFASVLKRDSEGRYLLETPAERGVIEVEDVPFLAVEVTSAGEGRDRTLTFRTNLDEIVMADADHPLRVEEDAQSGEPKPYVLVRPGLEARLTRSVYYELVELGAEESIDEEMRFGVWSGGRFFSLGTLTP
jgi:uncharacterized protein